MSLMRLVVELIEERGKGTADDILDECGGATRKQVMAAIANAVNLNLLERVGLSEKVPGRRAQRMCIYAKTGASPEGSRAKDRQLPPRGQYGHLWHITSVFDLGREAAC